MSVNICNIFRILNLDGDGDIEKYLKFVGVGEPFKNKWLPCVRDRESWMIVSPLRNSTPDSRLTEPGLHIPRDMEQSSELCIVIVYGWQHYALMRTDEINMLLFVVHI